MNTDCFNAYAERVPGLRLRAGDVVVLDNLGHTAPVGSRRRLNKALAAALWLVTKADIRGWLKHCGYSLVRK